MATDCRDVLVGDIRHDENLTCCRRGHSPFVYLTLSAAFAGIDSQVEETAGIFGASWFTIMRKLTFPLTWIRECVSAQTSVRYGLGIGPDVPAEILSAVGRGYALDRSGKYVEHTAPAYRAMVYGQGYEF